MDTATIESQGASPLQPYLEAIDDIKTHDDLIRVIAMLQKINVAVYFDWQVCVRVCVCVCVCVCGCMSVGVCIYV